MAKDYYEILGLQRNATKDEVRKAYLRLAKKHHPDLNKEAGAAEKFKEINEAASVLGDEKKREQYDRFGTTSTGFGGGNAGFDFTDFGGFENFGFDFGEMFDRFFGKQARGTRRQRRGADLQYEMEITLEEAAKGATKSIHIPRLERCAKCNGTGAESSAGIKKCEQCNGQGILQRTQRTAFGTFTTAGPCEKCSGTGRYIKNPCSMCDGEGRMQKTRTIDISIPAGIETGNRLRMEAEGEAGEQGTPPGDLYLTIHVKPHKTFEREDNNIRTELPISFTTAALGGEAEVPTLEGTATLKIPSGTQNNTTFRLKEKGIPSIHTGEKGDEYVTVTIKVPEKLSKKQKELLQEFTKEEKQHWF
ncbi:molecular chaperone DnaJ [Candidatus Woesearchaeota archaeon]|nr:molecular chaperone DnaJ [Candidatus Woesearchaeota archaeon]